MPDFKSTADTQQLFERVMGYALSAESFKATYMLLPQFRVHVDRVMNGHGDWKFSHYEAFWEKIHSFLIAWIEDQVISDLLLNNANANEMFETWEGEQFFVCSFKEIFWAIVKTAEGSSVPAVIRLSSDKGTILKAARELKSLFYLRTPFSEVKLSEYELLSRYTANVGITISLYKRLALGFYIEIQQKTCPSHSFFRHFSSKGEAEAGFREMVYRVQEGRLRPQMPEDICMILGVNDETSSD